MKDMAPRALRLVAAMKKLKAKIEANPDDPRMDVWMKRWNEYAQSVKNLKEHGVETIPTGNPIGVDITVPRPPKIGVKAKPPGTGA